MEQFSKVMLALAMLSLLLSYSGKRPVWLTTAAIFAVLSLIVAIGDISNVSSHTSNFFGEEVHVVSVGWGLWLTAVASLALAVGATSWRAEERRRKATEKLEAGKAEPAE